jgi:CheY-like chemotaxis protein
VTEVAQADSAVSAFSAHDPSPPVSSSSPISALADPSRDLAGALHEVSNALTVVLGWIDRARAVSHAPAEVERALEVAASRGAQARSIVRRAIGAEAPAESPAAVGAVVADALTGLEPELRRAGLQAVARVTPEVERLAIAHATSVLQILTNLLLNAAAMAPRGSLVRVEAAAADGQVVFSVTDAGPGVAPERRGALFEAGVTTRAGGAGIGLRHAAALARSQGGALSLADSAAGARFELLWPVLDGALLDLEPRSPPPTQPQTPVARRLSLPLLGTRILLVEDDDAVIDLLDTALTARGADVVSIRHRRDLPGALSTGPFDAGLFDISPIQDDVRGAVASARDASAGMRVVLISGSAVQVPGLPEAWISAWVRKPFEISEIIQAIEEPTLISRPG